MNLQKREKHNERSGKEKWHQMLINAFSDHYRNVDGIEGKKEHKPDHYLRLLQYSAK